MIRIVNLRGYEAKAGEVLIKVDRSSVLGNPYYMKNESHRDSVCDQYQIRFDLIVQNASKYPAFMKELRRIYSIAIKHDVALGCWCSPKRCHAETIMNFVNKYIKEDK